MSTEGIISTIEKIETMPDMAPETATLLQMAKDAQRTGAMDLTKISGKITSTIKDQCGSTVTEIEYRDDTGVVVGYWAYGHYDPELPYQGEKGRRP